MMSLLFSSSGLLAFIPYVGAAIGLVIGTGLALSQFSDWLPIIVVVVTFLVGQTAGDNLGWGTPMTATSHA